MLPGSSGSAPPASRIRSSPASMGRQGSQSVRRDQPRSPFPSRSEEHTSELQSLMRISYAVFCLKKKNNNTSNIRSPARNHLQDESFRICSTTNTYRKYRYPHIYPINSHN